MIRRRLAIVALAMAMIAGGCTGAAVRYYLPVRAALDATDDLRSVQALLEERRLDPTEEELVSAEAELNAADADFRDARAALDDPLARAVSRLPLVGSTVDAGPELMDMGIESVGIGHEAVAIAETYRRARDGGQGSLGTQSKEILEEIEPSMNAIDERLATIREQRRHIEGASLPPGAVDAIAELDRQTVQLQTLVQTYRDLAAFVPEFLGFNGPRTYLVLAQNNAELLPTGGLVSVYGLITVREGRVERKGFDDAVSFGGRWLERTDSYVAPPEPLRRYLLRDFSWNFAVSNWSPDFPTAAQEAQRFFRLAGGQPVDGVIAINVHTIETLLRVTGPTTVAEYGITVTPENALDVIEEHTRTALEPEEDRKALVGILAGELLSRLAEVPSDRWTELIDAMEQLRDERQLLVFANQPALQTAVTGLGVDGGLASTSGDYFMLVDASVNSTKLNAVIDQRIELRVALDADGGASHRARVDYQNDLPAWEQGRDPMLVQRLMLGGLYGGYVRVLAPRASLPQGALLDGEPAGLEESTLEGDKASFGRFFALPKGAHTQLTVRYGTPAIVASTADVAEYRLYVQKQSGTGAIPLRLHIDLPSGASLTSAELDGHELDSIDTIDSDLKQDRELIVRYRLD